MTATFDWCSFLYMLYRSLSAFEALFVYDRQFDIDKHTLKHILPPIISRLLSTINNNNSNKHIIKNTNSSKDHWFRYDRYRVSTFYRKKKASNQSFLQESLKSILITNFTANIIISLNCIMKPYCFITINSINSNVLHSIFNF